MGGTLSVSRRVFIQDARGGEGFLRATYHGEGRTVVISSWEGEVCVAATRLRVEDTADLIAMLARALAEAVEAGPAGSASVPPAPRSLRQRALAWVRRAAGRAEPPSPPGELHWMEDHHRRVV